MTKYFRCIKDFHMGNGELKHRNGIIYPKVGDEMPNEVSNQHSFDENSKLFKKHFKEVIINQEPDESLIADLNDLKAEYSNQLAFNKQTEDDFDKLSKSWGEVTDERNTLKNQNSLYELIIKKLIK